MTRALTAAGRVDAPAARLFWIDNLRVFLTALVLLHHSAITYSHLPIWTYYEPPHDASANGLDALIVVNQMWFMGLFFLVSGYFVPASVDRHGVRGFIRGRLLRLGLPLVIFVVALRALFVLPSWLAAGKPETFPAFLARGIEPGPLWFVLVLLVFSLGYAAFRAVADDRAQRPPGSTFSLWVIALLGLALGVLTYVWRIVVPDGSYWPIVGLPTPSYLPQYLGCFVIGCLAARRRWLELIPARVGVWSAVLAVVSLMGWSVAAIPGGEIILGGTSPRAFASAVMVSFVGVFVMTAVLVAFRSCTGTGRLRKWLSDNAFTVYVIHAPVLALGGLGLGWWSAPAAVKALALWVLGCVVCWVLASGIRRIPGARRVF